MVTRQNFSAVQRESAFRCNAHWLRDHRVTGVEIIEALQALRQAGQIYYCENCLFCHSSQEYFDVDHLVPDHSFKVWNKHPDAREAINMFILCKSLERGDLGCNQSKGARNYVPSYRGLAFSRQDIDMNYFPVHDRPFDWART
jgi:hypothetical protein